MIKLLLVLGAGITLVLGIVIALLLMAAKDLISQELRGWLELVPVALLRLVATRIPADQREDLYEQEWLPELLCHLRKAEGRPITCLVVGIRYSVSLFRSARTVARNVRDLSDSDETAAVNVPPDHVWEIAGGAATQSSAEGRIVTASAQVAAAVVVVASAEVKTQ